MFIVRKYISIFITVSAFGLSAMATGSTNGDLEKQQGQKPDGETGEFVPGEYAPYDLQGTEEEAETESFEEINSQVIEADSTYSSLSKFNFLFYFLYKYKYENRSAQQIEILTTD